jgi:hypothetical protein
MVPVPSTPNPFRYGSPVTGENFTGRKLEVQALIERVTQGVNVSVVSPRRYGKTSLLLAAERAAGRLGAIAVHVNVLLNPGPARFASALATSYARSRRHLLRRGAAAIAELRGRFRLAPTFEVGEDGRPRLSFSPSLAEPDAMGVLQDVYRLLSEDERQPALVLDEFDSIVDIEPRSADVLKGLADTYPRVSLVVAGSRRRMMERLVRIHGAPLYGMTQPIALGPIDPSTMARHLVRRAARGGKKMPAAIAEAIVSRAGPVPNDIQHLAFETFAVAGEVISFDDIDLGMDRAVALNEATYTEAWEQRSPVQRRVLAALAREAAAEPFGRGFARRTGLAPSTVQRAIEALASDDWVVATEGRWHLTDPVFTRWVSSLDRQ